MATTFVVAMIAISGGGVAPRTSVLVSDGGPSSATPMLRLIDRMPQRGIVLGAPDAPVTLVEFADLQCPACRQYASSVLPTLIGTFVASGKLRIVWRNLAFVGPDSLRAARMAAATALQNRLWGFIDVFFFNEGQENSGYATDAFLRSVARAVPGLDVTRAFADRGSGRAARQITQAAALARANRVESTPSFLIGRTNGTLGTFDPSSVTNPSEFTAAIKQLLST